MSQQVPWMLLAVVGVPLFMIYTKSKRIDARETHEVQMRVKYYSEYWAKGDAFSATLRAALQAGLARTHDPLLGRDVASVAPAEWRAAERWAATSSDNSNHVNSGSGSGVKRWWRFGL